MSSQQTCICNDETQTSTYTCFRCEAQWKVPTPHHDRVASCPLHHSSIAICGGFCKLCQACQDQGYFLSGGFGFELPTINKK